MSRLVVSRRRIEFVILRTASSPPVALHPASRRRSYFRLRGLGLPRHRLPLCKCRAFTGALIPALSRDPLHIAVLCKGLWFELDPGSSPGMTKKGQQHRAFKLYRAGSIVCAGLQILGVMCKVIAQERGDEVIAVVIPRLHAQGQWVARCLAGGLQQFGAQLR